MKQGLVANDAWTCLPCTFFIRRSWVAGRTELPYLRYASATTTETETGMDFTSTNDAGFHYSPRSGGEAQSTADEAYERPRAHPIRIFTVACQSDSLSSAKSLMHLVPQGPCPHVNMSVARPAPADSSPLWLVNRRHRSCPGSSQTISHEADGFLMPMPWGAVGVRLAWTLSISTASTSTSGDRQMVEAGVRCLAESDNGIFGHSPFATCGSPAKAEAPVASAGVGSNMRVQQRSDNHKCPYDRTSNTAKPQSSTSPINH